MILHISNDYSGSKVYMNLIKSLDKLGVPQIIYTPVKEKASIGRNYVDLQVPESKILYSNILNKTLDRVFYKNKIHKIFKDIEAKVNLKKVNVIHAHTWYSDGGVAFLLSKKYGIPYIVTIRNSDLNVFYKYLIHQRLFGRNILKFSKSVVLISASYKSRVLSLNWSDNFREMVKPKIQIIPNGVDQFWIKNSVAKKSQISSKINLLFIGKFTSGKNILAVQKAVLDLYNSGLDINLNIVGGKGDKHDMVIEYCNSNPNVFKYYGEVFDKERLRSVFEESDVFVMPSKYETFGLVYVEALLQGIPVLYTHNEGIDGFYKEAIGEKVHSGSVLEIRNKIKNIINNYHLYNIPLEKIKFSHDWDKIAEKYLSLYFN